MFFHFQISQMTAQEFPYIWQFHPILYLCLIGSDFLSENDSQVCSLA